MTTDNITDRDLEIARQGATAFEQGKALSENPYSGDDAMWWSIGWNQAKLSQAIHSPTRPITRE